MRVPQLIIVFKRSSCVRMVSLDAADGCKYFVSIRDHRDLEDFHIGVSLCYRHDLSCAQEKDGRRPRLERIFREDEMSSDLHLLLSSKGHD